MPPKSGGSNKSYQKHAKSSKIQPISHRTADANNNSKDARATKDSVSLALQQKLLSIFRNAFPSRFEPDLPAWLQEVKRFLYHREFSRAFERDEYREAYAVRWSPSRALGYLEILAEVVDGIRNTKNKDVEETEHCEDIEDSMKRLGLEIEIKIVCLGGGAGAEMVSLAGVLNILQQEKTPALKESDENIKTPDTNPIEVQRQDVRLNVGFIDIANWASILDRLYKTITTPPVLSSYASAAVKVSNAPLVPAATLSFTFHQHDVLKLQPGELYSLVGDCDLVTLFFTLNELYTTSSPLTQTFLLNLTACTKVGSLLLVVDSAGSYSEVGLGKEEVKKYPMQWLLDHTLLKSATEVGFSHPVDSLAEDESSGRKKERKILEGRRNDVLKWEKLRDEESCWFRLPDGLKYPLELENMRYQVHLYRRIAGLVTE